MTFQVPNRFRVRTGRLATHDSDGNNGLFFVRLPGKRDVLRVIASDGGLPGGTRWEHVSVSLPQRCPTWEEMCQVKDLFWSPDACVVQYHPPRADYINCHDYCLHLWRPVGIDLPRPPSVMVGPQAPVRGLA